MSRSRPHCRTTRHPETRAAHTGRPIRSRANSAIGVKEVAGQRHTPGWGYGAVPPSDTLRTRLVVDQRGVVRHSPHWRPSSRGGEPLDNGVKWGWENQSTGAKATAHVSPTRAATLFHRNRSRQTRSRQPSEDLRRSHPCTDGKTTLRPRTPLPAFDNYRLRRPESPMTMAEHSSRARDWTPEELTYIEKVQEALAGPLTERQLTLLRHWWNGGYRSQQD